MKLGIKVSPKQNSLADLDATHAPFCEVWYNATKPDDYDELFAGIKKRGIEAGLHYWGALPDGTWTNLAYPDPTLIDITMDLMQHTIDTAARHGFPYVNIHPGTAARVRVDFDAQTFELLSEPVALDIAQKTFLEYAQTLHEYAAQRGVVLTIETVPLLDMNGWYNGNAGRLHPINVYELPVSVNLAAAKAGLWIANDFTHTAANIISNSAKDVWNFVRQTTVTLAPRTRLVHIGFIVPPYNGTDMHDNLDNPLLDTDQAVPNKKQLIELLKLFAGRDDVWTLVEPESDHVRNYFLAEKILNESLR